MLTHTLRIHACTLSIGIDAQKLMSRCIYLRTMLNVPICPPISMHSFNLAICIAGFALFITILVPRLLLCF